MIFSPHMSLSLSKYLLGNRLKGLKRYPMVLMLEPTLMCNLACTGCGRIREYSDVLDKMMPYDECLNAVDESNAPVVCITGGEPLLHPDILKVIDAVIARKRFIHLCTNGLVAEKYLEKLKPGPYLSLVFHIDGMERTHDEMACRDGVFRKAISAISAAKAAGFSVLTNTTIYKNTDPKDIERLWMLLSEIRTDGIMVSPAFSYVAVDKDVFMSRQEMTSAFQPIYAMRRRFRFYNTPIYLDFLAGKRKLHCVPWSTPTYNTKGWKRPCYLITDGHCQSYRELMQETEWSKYGVGRDPRCNNCMVHCGFEVSALDEIGRSPRAMLQTANWEFFGGWK
jgi:hopanoid biosynthesis associated radical SAM protein HpnH